MASIYFYTVKFYDLKTCDKKNILDPFHRNRDREVTGLNNIRII